MSEYRGRAARQDAVRRYAAAHDRFAEQEQVAREGGDAIAAEDAHRYALICLHAALAELEDPDLEVAR